MLYQVHLVRGQQRSRCSDGSVRCNQLRSGRNRPVDACRARRGCVIDLALLWWSAAGTSYANMCLGKMRWKFAEAVLYGALLGKSAKTVGLERDPALSTPVVATPRTLLLAVVHPVFPSKPEEARWRLSRGGWKCDIVQPSISLIGHEMGYRMVLGRWATLSYPLCNVACSPFFRGQIRLYYIQATDSSDSGTHTPCPISLPLHHHTSRGLSDALQQTGAASSSRRHRVYTTYRCGC
jgi:hypothetical protein